MAVSIFAMYADPADPVFLVCSSSSFGRRWMQPSCSWAARCCPSSTGVRPRCAVVMPTIRTAAYDNTVCLVLAAQPWLRLQLRVKWEMSAHT